MTSEPDEGAASDPPHWRIRTVPEDFRVVEEPLYEATGEGGHTFILIEKRGRTTEHVARDLARAAGVSARDVGYAGRKDRWAVTRQWFSIEGVEPARALEFDLSERPREEGVDTDGVQSGVPPVSARVLEAHAHPHKIRTGHLRANHFEIIVRGELDHAGTRLGALHARAEALIERGLPNRFGDQRFGRDGDNAERARELLSSGRPPRDRRAARFLVSALQSAVFNHVLEARIDHYDEVQIGDLARVEESGGLYWVDDLDRDRERAKRFEISATGPIFGTKMRVPQGEVEAIERAAYEAFGVPAPGELELPRGIRARGTRRPLRIPPQGLSIDPLETGEGFRLVCALPPGAYVTVLLDELLGRGRVGEGNHAARTTVESGAPVVP